MKFCLFLLSLFKYKDVLQSSLYFIQIGLGLCYHEILISLRRWSILIWIFLVIKEYHFRDCLS